MQVRIKGHILSRNRGREVTGRFLLTIPCQAEEGEVSEASQRQTSALLEAATSVAAQADGLNMAFALSWPQWLQYFEQADSAAERKEELALDLKVRERRSGAWGHADMGPPLVNE